MIKKTTLLLFLINFILLINNCYPGSTDEFCVRVGNFSLRVSWGLQEDFNNLSTPGYFFDLILLCDHNYSKIEDMDDDINFFCSQSGGSGYKIAFYLNGNFAASYKVEKEPEILNKVIDVLTGLLFKEKLVKKSVITLFMVSIPNLETEAELLPLLSSSEIYYGASMGILNNPDGYTFFYFFRKEKALYFINNKLKSEIIIFNKKQFTENNINDYFNETLLKKNKKPE